jgi:phosphoglycerate dehydrogenase-like enzyme
MKRSAIFVNTSRGPMVDENALYDALSNGTVAGAGLDVHTVEPRAAPDKLSTLRNIVMTPHLAGGSRTGIVNEVEAVLDNCRAVLAGQPINHQVKA